MKRYELTFLISPYISREEIDQLCQKIGEFIKNEGGNVEEIRNPLRKELGVVISKNREAFLETIIFYLPSEKIEELEKLLSQEKDIIRQMIVINKKEKEDSILKKAPKAELEEIDQKIDEILDN